MDFRESKTGYFPCISTYKCRVNASILPASDKRKGVQQHLLSYSYCHFFKVRISGGHASLMYFKLICLCFFFFISFTSMTTKFDIFKFKVLSALGNLDAMFNLGNNYLLGIGVDVDLEKSHSYLQKAARRGFVPAKDFLEIAFADKGEKANLNPDFSRIYESFCSVCQDADKGMPEALYLKSVHKLSDDANDYIFNRGVKGMALACEQGFAPALYSLGMVYYSGKRIFGKKEKGRQMIIQSAEKEFVPAIKALETFDLDRAYAIVKRLAQVNEPSGDILYMLGLYYLRGAIVKQDSVEGVRLLKEASQRESIEAMYLLGNIYRFGLFGIDPDIDTAVKYFEQGAEKGGSDCMNDLAVILENSEDYPHDMARAFELYSKAVEQGNVRAYNNLGTCYKRAIGTDQDAQKAIDCYEKAVEGGCLDAYWNLFLFYIDNACIPQDIGKAVEWLKKGDSAGFLKCTYQLSKQYMLGDGVEVDAGKAFECLKKASVGCYEEAYEELGDCYRYGIGTECDGSQAFGWYKKAAEFSVSAQCKLAQCYTYAIGVEKDDGKAVELYKVAAEHGNAQAQFDLGICYRYGEGVEQDPLMAISWYLKAAEQGHSGAMCNLGVMYDNGIGVEKDPVKAFEFFKKSAEAGHMDGQFCLASMYYSGRGVEQDYEKAVKWFKAAAEQGEPDSMFHLAMCYYEGHGVEVDYSLFAKYLYESADRGFQNAIDVINKNRIPRPNNSRDT